MCVDYKFTIYVSLYFSHGHEEGEEKKRLHSYYLSVKLLPYSIGRWKTDDVDCGFKLLQKKKNTSEYFIKRRKRGR